MKKITITLALLLTLGLCASALATDAGVKGDEGGSAKFYLWADQGDDAADKAYVEMTAANLLTFNVGGVDVATIDSAGAFTVIGAVTGVGDSSVSNLTVSGEVTLTTVTASGTATALMTNAPAITEETPVWITVTVGTNDYVIPAWLKD